VSSLDQIEIEVRAPINLEMIYSVVTEIKALLERLLIDGERGEIDIKNLPLSSGDKEALNELLGVGEVSILLNVMGDTTISETSYPGVWRVVHRDVEGRLLADSVEISSVPSFVEVGRAEIKDALEQLNTIDPGLLDNNSFKV